MICFRRDNRYRPHMEGNYDRLISVIDTVSPCAQKRRAAGRSVPSEQCLVACGFALASGAQTLMAATSAHRKASSSFRSLAGTNTARHDYRTRVLMRTGMAGIMKTMGRSSSVTDLFAKHQSWEYTLSVLRGGLYGAANFIPHHAARFDIVNVVRRVAHYFWHVGSWIACSRRPGGQRAHSLAHSFGRRRAPRPCLSRSSGPQLALETAGRDCICSLWCLPDRTSSVGCGFAHLSVGIPIPSRRHF